MLTKSKFSMLNLTPTPNTHRQADNLMPLENDQYETRPGFFQVVSEPVSLAVGWGEAGVYQLATTDDQTPVNRIWQGGIVEDITVPVDLSLIHISEPTRPY